MKNLIILIWYHEYFLESTIGEVSILPEYFFMDAGEPGDGGCKGTYKVWGLNPKTLQSIKL